MLVSLSAVVASDADDTTLNSNDDNLTVQITSNENIDGQLNDEINSKSTQDVLLANSNDDILGAPGTFQDLQNYINSQSAGSTINLANDYVYPYSYNGGGVSITKSNLVIDGHGHYIDGNGYSRIFTISGSNIILKNLIIKNGKAAGGSGSAIYSSGNLDIINCTFESNANTYNSKMYGGAVYITGQSRVLNVYNSTFTKNTAIGYGGAINGATTNGRVYIFNTKFSENSVSYDDMEYGGGAIFTNGNTELVIEYSNFTKNSAKNSEGGCIRHSGRLVVDHCYFDSNVARDGGAIVGGNPNNSNAAISNCTFVNNYANRWGGALQQRKTVVYDSIFINNSVNLTTVSSNGVRDGPHGGAVYARDYVNMYNCKFIENQARKGGAVYYEDRVTSAILDNCTFISNGAKQIGGAVYVDTAAKITIVSSNFTKNSAVEGGAIYIYSANLPSVEISSSEFTQNTATGGSGGAIYDGGQSLKISGSSFNKNTASDDGGAIYSKNLNVINSYFMNNIANDDGGALYVYLALELNTVEFTNNQAILAGAIYAPNVKADGITLVNNNATFGGALYLDGSTSTESSIANSEFRDNKASDDGGAIYINSGSGLIDNTRFITNTAGSSAGALFWNRGNGKVSKSTFRDNTADKDGGAIYWGSDSGQILTSTFNNNAANSRGGAVYWVGNYGKLSDSTFSSNSAQKGDDIYWRGNSGTLSGSMVNGNGRTTDLVYWHGSNGDMSENIFNSAKVFICQHASVSLTKNTQTSDSYSDYSIRSLGNITLYQNVFHNAIYNEGLIKSSTSIVILDNTTIVTNDPTFNIYSAILDDNGNYIKLSDNLNNTYNNDKYSTIVLDIKYL